MMNKITGLTKLINEDSTSPRIDDFEKHTKAFGSSYMKKYGFVKGMGLGKNEQGHQEPVPFIKNNKTFGVGTNGPFLEEWYPFDQRLLARNLRLAHLKSR
jgi:hypothetical protein